MILPIGQYLGAAGARRGDAHEVRRGDVIERLGGTGFAVWGLAHGPIDRIPAAGTPWTGAELVSYASHVGLAGAAGEVSTLIDRGLLTETPATGPEARAFARAHRAVPLAIGLGNSPEQPELYTIGAFDGAQVQVDELQYGVWCWSAAYRSLWDVCGARAAARDPGGAAAGSAGASPAGTDPAEVLRHFLPRIHQLASADALYLDVVGE